MPAINTTKMTARQFLELGQDPPGVRLELVDGEIEIGANRTPAHSYADRMLGNCLMGYILERDIGALYGDVSVILDEHNIRRPDIIYFTKDRLHLVGEKAIEGPPDLCVEIVSASSATIDRTVKFDLYQAGGVSHYWIIDPHSRTFEAYSVVNGQYKVVTTGREEDIVKAPPFDALSIALGKLWR